MAITVTPSVESGNWPPRVRLNVTASAGETSTTVTRLDANGFTIPVRTSDGNPLAISGGAALIYDLEMVYGTSVAYSSLESPATVSAPVAVTVPQVWLVHTGLPALSFPVNNFRPGSFAKRTRAVKRGVFYPMGRENPVVVTSGARQGIETSATVLVRTSDELAAMDALLDDAGTLLLNIPSSLGYSMAACYVTVGDVDYAPVTNLLGEDWLDVTLPLTVVDRPAGGSQAQRVWLDVMAAYPTWQAVMAAYPKWSDVIAGP